MATHTVNVIASLDPASKSTGGNESADAGKLLEFNSEGQIQGSSNSSSLAAVKGTASGSGYGVRGESSSGTGVVGQSTTGNGVDASSNAKQAVSAINFHATEPVIKAKNANAANTAPLAQFHRNNNQGLTIKNDGGLEWDSATGPATTRAGLGLGTAALQPSTAFDPAGSAAAAQAAAIAASQPLDSDLTAIAALSTTAYGRALLTLADAASGRTSFGLGTASTVNTGTGASDVPTITDADARYELASDTERVGLSSPFTTSSNTLVNITGVAVTLEANSIYQVYAYIVCQSTNTATGFGQTFSFTGSPTKINILGQQQRTLTDPITTALNDITASDEVLTHTSVPTANTDMFCLFRGVVITSGSASVMQARIVRGGSANNVSASYGYIIATKIA
jgi:hypothetical protein